MTARALAIPGASPRGAVRPAPPAAPLRRSWDPLLIALAVYLLSAVGRIHQLFPVLGALKPAMVAGLAAIVLYAADASPARRLLPALRAMPTMYVLGLLLWGALSVPGSIYPGQSFGLVANELLKTVAVFLVAVGACREWKDVERLAFVYFLAIAIYSTVVLLRFDIGGSWRLNNLYYYDANDFATLAVTALPLGLYFATRRAVPRWWRLAGIGGSLFTLLAFVWSGSRGGFLALIAVAAFLLFRFTAIPARWRILSTAVMTALFVLTASETFWEKMGTLFNPTEDYNYTDSGGRLPVWKRGMGYMIDRPVFGLGAGTFEIAEGTLPENESRRIFGRGWKWSAAHNSFVQAGAEMGIPGLVLFTGALAGAFISLRRVRVRRRGVATAEAASLGQSLTASLIGFVVGGFFLSLAYADLVYMLLAFAAALAKTERARRMAAPSLRGYAWRSYRS